VSQVVLIQSQTNVYPRFRPGSTFLHRAAYRSVKRIDLEIDNLAPLNAKSRFMYVWERVIRCADIVCARTAIALNPLLKKIGIKGFGKSMTYVLESLAIAHQKALDKYEPRPYDGKVILLRAERQLGGIEPDETLGWGDLLGGPFETYEVPGHQQNMLKEPNVPVLARRLRECLDEKAMPKGMPLPVPYESLQQTAEFVPS
jgi:hypothetical protein